MDNKEQLLNIIIKYKEELQKKIKARELEMQKDKNDHYIVYHALGFTSEEGYQSIISRMLADFCTNMQGLC